MTANIATGKAPVIVTIANRKRVKAFPKFDYEGLCPYCKTAFKSRHSVFFDMYENKHYKCPVVYLPRIDGGRLEMVLLPKGLRQEA